MKRLFTSLVLIAALASCKKEETPVDKTYTVEYNIKATSKANTSFSGNVTYVSKTSASATASFSTSPWTVTETAWNLKAGDKVGCTVTLTDVASYQVAIIVNGGVKVIKQETSTFMPSPTTVSVEYIVE